MNLVYYRGLNCHLSSVISIAAAMGIDYHGAYGRLWSETDFLYNHEFGICLSRRILPSLEQCGAKFNEFCFDDSDEAASYFEHMENATLFTIKMDVFHMPWSIFYRARHEFHYFFARKENAQRLTCFDPTYDKRDIGLPSGVIMPHVRSLGRVSRLPVYPPPFEAKAEAHEILRKHDKTHETLLSQIENCTGAETSLISHLTAMINNRHLFSRYLRRSAGYDQFFDSTFLSKWDAVKNGIHKIYITRNSVSIKDEVCRLFSSLMRSEIALAEEMITMKELS